MEIYTLLSEFSRATFYYKHCTDYALGSVELKRNMLKPSSDGVYLGSAINVCVRLPFLRPLHAQKKKKKKLRLIVERREIKRRDKKGLTG